VLRGVPRQTTTHSIRPVRPTPPDGATLFPSAAGGQTLSPGLPGVRPKPSDRHQAAAIETGLAQLHRVLSSYSTEPRPGMSGYGDLERLHARIPDPFALTAAELGLPDTPETRRYYVGGATSWLRYEASSLARTARCPGRSSIAISNQETPSSTAGNCKASWTLSLLRLMRARK
jgi:hypothetical protein